MHRRGLTRVANRFTRSESSPMGSCDGADSMLIPRRAMLTLIATSMAPRFARAQRVAAERAALPVPPGDRIGFRLMRHGGEIGRHTVNFTTQGDVLSVHVAVDAQVSLMSIPIVHYSHRVVETWRDGVLIGLDGQTDKNGEHEWVNARRAADGLEVNGSQTPRYIAPEPAAATTYWNRHTLDFPLISLEDGVLLRPTVTLHRDETVALASGERIAADHYAIRGPFSVDLWYDRSNIWAGMAVPVADGSLVTYERL